MSQLRTFQLALAAGTILLAPAAFAGGYNSSGTSAQIKVLGGTSTLKVKHKDTAFAKAYVAKDGSGAVGGGTSSTVTVSETPAVTLKRSVSTGNSYADNKNASASGATYTLVKVQAADGSYFVYKGSVGASAQAGKGGPAFSNSGSFATRSGKK